MTDEQFTQLIALLSYEQSGIEVKSAGPRTDKHLAAKVVRAALSMANRRDGGLVILEVDDNAGSFSPTGLTQADLATWRYDDVATLFAVYADPPFTFTLEVHTYNGHQ